MKSLSDKDIKQKEKMKFVKGIKPPEKKKEIPCPNCGGSGQDVIGENRVSLDMAIDAGDRSLEGSFYSYVYGECQCCNGTGVIEEDST